MASRQVPERTQRGSVLLSRPRGGKERLRAVLLPELCRVPPRSSPFKCSPAARAAASLTCGAVRLPPLRSPGGRGGRAAGRDGAGRGGTRRPRLRWASGGRPLWEWGSEGAHLVAGGASDLRRGGKLGEMNGEVNAGLLKAVLGGFGMWGISGNRF